MIYFDNAATSYYRPPGVKEAVAEAIDTFGNPSRGAYGASLDADRCLFRTRLQLASLFQADGPDCVAFTMNATQALNEAIFGQELKKGDHLIVSLQEHNSVLRPAYRLREQGVNVHFAGLTEDGLFDIDDYRNILRAIRKRDSDPDRRIVTALAHGSNVTGNVIDLKQVSGLCRTYRSSLIIDAAQTAGIIPIDMKEDGIDILCMSGHKALMGPQGTGAIIVRRGESPASLMTGGSGIKTFLETMPEDMPARLEAGTQNSHSVAGLSAALSFAEGKREEWRVRERRLREQFLEGIDDINKSAGQRAIHVYGCPRGGQDPSEDAAGQAKAAISGTSGEYLPTVAFNVGELEAGAVADRLWHDREIAVRAGGHCAPLIHRFFGTEKRGIVRASFSHYNTEKQVDVLIEELRSIVQEV